jgi:DNA repair ATPase RecN
MDVSPQHRTEIQVHNVGGIDTASLNIDDGVTVLLGENASNRSSFLSALAGVLGARIPLLKTDATQGAVSMRIDDDEYWLDLSRRDGSVVAEREPLTDDQQLCDQFVRLLEDNPLRASVERMDGEELYDLLMRPVDTAELEAEIERVQRERREIRDTLSNYDDLEGKLGRLRTQRTTLRSDLDEVESELTSVRDRMDSLRDDAIDDESERELLQTLESKRSEHRELVDKIGTHTRAIERLESEREDVRSELDELAGDDAVGGDLDSIESELERLRARKRQLDNTLETVQTLIEVNSRTSADTVEKLRDDETGHVTDALDPNTTVTCWTCGSEVERSDIEAQVAELETIVEERQAERDEVAQQIDALQQRRDRLTEHRRRVERLQESESELTAEIHDHEETTDTLRAQQADLEATIENLEADAEEIRQHDDSEYVSLSDRANELEYERGQLERQLADVNAEIDDIESTIADRETVVERREELSERLEELQERIYRIERETVDTINETMADVLAQLQFGNIERIWVERRVGDGATTGGADEFALHVVRTDDDGAAYEDTIETLSTSEREVVGIVLAVAGYLVHDVEETVPILLLDAIESLDAERIGSLLSYLTEHTQYLVATAHPEDHDAFPSGFDRVHIEDALE